MNSLVFMPAVIISRTDHAIAHPHTILAALERIGRTTISPILSILVIVVIAMLVLRAIRTIIRRSIQRLVERGDSPSRELTLKVNTLSSVVESGGRLVVVVVASMMILSKIGINIAPLLASAGVVGIAIGLGAQSLIKDFIGGFLVLFEDQYGVGDVITVNGFSGVVEHVSLRRTGIRGTNGSFTIIPNGDVRAVQNLTKDWSRAVVDVDISHDDDVDHAIDVLTEMMKGIEDDPELGSAIIAPADILGIQSMGPYQVTLRVMVKTRPMEQWRVQRELLRRIKQVLYSSGATIPYPRSVTVVHATDGQEAPHAAPLFAAVLDEPAAPEQKPSPH
ncbi:MAG TPA: mechanosensitive ion channel family protein [Nitrolancea sp.]|nr:mechanosensitive ion channel family protein [Nitrolancea sp.]